LRHPHSAAAVFGEPTILHHRGSFGFSLGRFHVRHSRMTTGLLQQQQRHTTSFQETARLRKQAADEIERLIAFMDEVFRLIAS
jgi:hypothetical protein